MSTFLGQPHKAVQYGQTIFRMSASFAIPQEGPEHQSTMLDKDPELSWIDRVPTPDDIQATNLLKVIHAPEEGRGQLTDWGFSGEDLIDIRFIHPSQTERITNSRADQMAWVRTREDLPNENLVHVCAITYFSDLSLVGTILAHHGGRTAGEGRDLASIDHAMWFHRRIRANEWLLFVTHSPIATGGQGFARGEFYDARGHLLASAAQEVLVRDRRK